MTLLLGLLALCGLALATGAAAIFAPTRWAFRYCLAVAMLALGVVAWAAPAFARLLDDHREGWQILAVLFGLMIGTPHLFLALVYLKELRREGGAA